jgi:hypothetical protein
VRGNNHEKKFDTGKIFQKTEKNKKTTAPASVAYAPAIHGKYMQFFEIEVSEVDGISNEIKFLLPFTLFKTVHYICAEKILHLHT